MCERVTVLNLSVSQSVILSHNKNRILKLAASQRLKEKKKHQDIALDILSLFNVSEFFDKASLFEAV